ncbi:MAG: hypothetical protein Q8J64_06645 [Thermodesulfovibrionales bacterium]|nr:hypothetical protein [Thermodesulfovibrionales bacterium]
MEKALTINSIGDLQLALIENNNGAIKDYIERLDRETSNEVMARAGEYFGFPTVEIEGVIRASAGHLARVFGYKRTQAFIELLERRGISGIKVAGFTHNTLSIIREKLGLGDKDFSAVLYDWPAFLIGGMNSTNTEAQVVQAYLLRMEKVARVGIVAVRQGQLTANFPEAAHGIVMSKLCKEAWRGNPLASYILERFYDVPVKQLLHRTDPELSEVAGTISQFLHFIAEDRLTAHGLKVTKTAEGWKVDGVPEMLYKSFIETARRHHLTQFFGSVASLGAILGREADALEMLGWRRSVRRIQGCNHYTYEYLPVAEIKEISLN